MVSAPYEPPLSMTLGSLRIWFKLTVKNKRLFLVLYEICNKIMQAPSLPCFSTPFGCLSFMTLCSSSLSTGNTTGFSTFQTVSQHFSGTLVRNKEQSHETGVIKNYVKTTVSFYSVFLSSIQDKD